MSSEERKFLAFNLAWVYFDEAHYHFILNYKCSASEKHITALSMEPGDVLLVDNYRALHGRDVFQGDRFHAVTWFTWDQNEEWRGNERRIVEKNAFNQAIK